MSVETFKDLQNTDLNTLITESFQKGLESGSVVFTQPKDVEILDDDDTLTVELKVLDGLKKKEDAGKTENKPETPFNPFLNPEKDLVVVEDLIKDYRLLLNKFPVSDNHFLLTTKEFKSQNDLLKPEELLLAYELVRNLNNAKKLNNFFAFFNSGPESGFSQQHRHIQFVKYPLKNLKPFPEYTVKGKDFFVPKEGEEPLVEESMPFKHYILPLPKSWSEIGDDDDTKRDTLSIAYITLFRKILNFFKNLSKKNESEQLDNNLNVKLIPVSYNLIMNDKFIMVVPRQSATYGETGISINALGFVGLLLAKNESQRAVIKDEGITKILAACGFSNDLNFNKEDEYDY